MTAKQLPVEFESIPQNTDGTRDVHLRVIGGYSYRKYADLDVTEEYVMHTLAPNEVHSVKVEALKALYDKAALKWDDVGNVSVFVTDADGNPIGACLNCNHIPFKGERNDAGKSAEQVTAEDKCPCACHAVLGEEPRPVPEPEDEDDE